MAKHVLRDAKLWLDGFDLSGDMNSLALEYAADDVENTVFGNLVHTFQGGLKSVRASHAGLWEAGVGEVDEVLFNRLGLVDVPMTIGPTTGADGEPAFGFLSREAEYSPGGSVGEILAFTVTADASGDLVRGTIMHNAARSAGGNGTARQLGAVLSGQRVYGALHVVASSGGNLNVKVQSDDNSGMTSAIDRITFAQKTAIGSEWLSTAGPITDDWWRVTWTLTGTATFIVLVAIQ